MRRSLLTEDNGGDYVQAGPSGWRNLTAYEIASLPKSCNLTDGHAFRRWDPAEQQIIDSAPNLFKSNHRRMQPEIEREYVRDFCRLARQSCDESAFAYLMCFTASMAFEIVANYLRLRRFRLTLLEPAFDNLADIFRRHEIPLTPIPDLAMEAPAGDFARLLEAIDTEAICLVTPNNPTGATLAAENLRRLAQFCRSSGKLLILDACFRAYLPRNEVYDQYRILAEEEVDCVVIEDTGKTWPTAEIKAPFFAISRPRGLFRDLYDIYTDFLLHVSPVGIKLMHEFIRLSIADDLASIRRPVAENRRVLTRCLERTSLTPAERPFQSVAWLRIDYPLTASELKQTLEENGVFVLPGDYFYWSNRSLGEKYIRVALARDPDIFAEAAERLGEVCRKVAQKALA